jgi:hypothetical protein
MLRGEITGAEVCNSKTLLHLIPNKDVMFVGVVLGGVMVIVLVIGPKICWFKLG